MYSNYTELFLDMSQQHHGMVMGYIIFLQEVDMEDFVSGYAEYLRQYPATKRYKMSHHIYSNTHH